MYLAVAWCGDDEASFTSGLNQDLFASLGKFGVAANLGATVEKVDARLRGRLAVSGLDTSHQVTKATVFGGPFEGLVGGVVVKLEQLEIPRYLAGN